MTTITLSMMSRWGLEDLLGNAFKAMGKEEGTHKERRVFSRIRGKIKIDDDTRDVILDLITGQPATADQPARPGIGDRALRGYPDVTVDLETEYEVPQLRELLKTAKLPVAADRWIDPIMEQLEGTAPTPLPYPIARREKE
jgi:hypothetical protein